MPTSPYAFRTLLCGVMLTVALAAAAAKPPHRLKVNAATDRISVDDATPGGDVLIIGYELTSRDTAPVHRQVRAELTADAAGNVEFEPKRELAQNAFWVAFDLTTGAYGAVAGSKRQLREAELRDEALRGNGSRRNTIQTRFDRIYTVVIRPGVGVWDGLAGDGAAGDADAALNGTIVTSVRELNKLGRTASSLDEVEAGDVIAIFVPRPMGFMVTEVKK